MSRERARSFRGAGYREPRRGPSWTYRQQLRRLHAVAEQPAPKATLADKVLPWRRRKARAAAQRREVLVAHLRESEQELAEYAAFRHAQKPWRGILTTRERQRLSAIKLVPDDATFDHPQRRRIERDERRVRLAA
jgi:hypothetical protein